MFKKSFKILNFRINGSHPKFTVLFHFGTQLTTGNPKILLKTRISAKTAALGISNSQVREKSQKNPKILVKLNKKETFFWGPNYNLGKIFETEWRGPIKLDGARGVWHLLLRVFGLLLPGSHCWGLGAGLYLQPDLRFS